ncbi:MAG: hypothetical protein CMA06_03885 [Euryarchaeota archaeon]|nr:hypothetical protein [Euryarchaeota archaeon]MDC0040226.1 hypothetical protein [Candidatus Poseidoniales archaeon]MDC0151714.1 hypothetical protein [bacterium]MDC0045820.1 hypothetical protein [Candidatus Poseidoniales archaeon]MDC0183688.1 hypothetical protein [Candidatus Poseidoniales archaeon]|tara:strand:+ start:6341 stop:6712 length:372 start_codon:yes stop_codon:yes gene_type:complete
MFQSVDLLSSPEAIFVMILLGMMFICYCFAVHLIVTWNPHHRPIIPLTASLILSIGPMVAFSYMGDGESSLGAIFEWVFFVIFVEAGVLVLWLPPALALVTFQMFRVTFWKPSEDPLMDMIEN